MELFKWLGSQQGFWTIAGTIVGAILGFGANLFIQWRQHSRQRQIARMQIASNLRHWMSAAASAVGDTAKWLGSDGLGGREHIRLPKFRFEQSLDQVSLLDRQIALDIFNLIHAKDDANDEINLADQYDGHDDALHLFCGRSAELYLLTMPIYKKLARQVGWREATPSEDEREMMESHRDSLRQRAKAWASASVEIFAEDGAKGLCATGSAVRNAPRNEEALMANALREVIRSLENRLAGQGTLSGREFAQDVVDALKAIDAEFQRKQGDGTMKIEAGSPSAGGSFTTSDKK